MEPGRWTDIQEQGQFLLELEFLTRHTHPEPRDKTKPTVIAESACVYTTSPPYLVEIARQFPWVHFFAFQHVFAVVPGVADAGGSEYDPAQPSALVRITGPSYQTEHNRTMSVDPIDKESITTLSRVKEDKPAHRGLVLICHGETPTRQLMLHSALRADHSMLDVCGAISQEYAAGELVLPVQIPQNKVFTSLVVSLAAEARAPCSKVATYDPEGYMDELCFFQHTLRASEAYDQASKDLIIREYAQRFSWYHQVDPDTIEQILKAIVCLVGCGRDWYQHQIASYAPLPSTG